MNNIKSWLLECMNVPSLIILLSVLALLVFWVGYWLCVRKSRNYRVFGRFCVAPLQKHWNFIVLVGLGLVLIVCLFLPHLSDEGCKKLLKSQTVWLLISVVYFWYAFRFLWSSFLVGQQLKQGSISLDTIIVCAGHRATVFFEMITVFVMSLMVWFLTLMQNVRVFCKPEQLHMAGWIKQRAQAVLAMDGAASLALFFVVLAVFCVCGFTLQLAWRQWRQYKHKNNTPTTRLLLCGEIVLFLFLSLSLFTVALTFFTEARASFEGPTGLWSRWVDPLLIVAAMLVLLVVGKMPNIYKPLRVILSVISYIACLCAFAPSAVLVLEVCEKLLTSNPFDHQLLITGCALWSLIWISTLVLMGCVLLPSSFEVESSTIGETRGAPENGNEGNVKKTIVRRRYYGDARIKAVQFYIEAILRQPIPFAVGLLLHSAACVYPVFHLYNADIVHINISYYYIVILAVTSIPMFLGPVFVAYLDRKQCLSDGARRTIEHKILSNLTQHHVVVGYGNLGSLVLAKDYLLTGGLSKHSLFSDFAVLAEDDVEIRVIGLWGAVVDRDDSVFDVVFEKDSGTSSVGLVSITHDLLISLHNRDPLHGDSSHLFYESGIACAAVCGNAALKNTMDLVSWRSAHKITITTSTDDVALWIIPELNRVSYNQQKMIVKFNRGASFRQYGSKHLSPNVELLSIYPSRDESENILKYACVDDGVPLEDKGILVLGSGRRIYHLLSAVACVLDPSIQLDEWIKDHVFLLTDDHYIEKSSMMKGTKMYWPIYPYRFSDMLVNVPCRYVPHLEYDAIRFALENLNHDTTTILAFADQASFLIESLQELAATIKHKHSKVTICASSAAKATSTHSVLSDGRLMLREVMHDEVIASEIISAYKTIGGTDNMPANKIKGTLRMLFCETDGVGILLWKSLVFAGFKPDDASGIIDSAQRQRKVAENDGKEKWLYPSLHYYFTDTPACNNYRDGKSCDNAFTFRAGISFYDELDLDEGNVAETIKHLDVDVIGDGVDENAGTTHAYEEFFLYDLFGKNKGSDVDVIKLHGDCSTLCPVVDKAIKTEFDLVKDGAGKVARVAVEKGESHDAMGSMHVTCEGYDDPGALAYLLAVLVTGSTNPFLGKDCDALHDEAKAFDLQFIKDSEYCSASRTLCACYGHLIDISKETHMEQLQSYASKTPIVGIHLEGAHPAVERYAYNLADILGDAYGIEEDGNTYLIARK